MPNPMNLFKRVTRVALIAWALYLTIALAAFALHVHAPHEEGGPVCALCIAHNVTSAAGVIASFVLLGPTLCWRLQLWFGRVESAFVTIIKSADEPRGPPAKCFPSPQLV